MAKLPEMKSTESIRERTQGRWRAILPILGLDERFLSGKNMGCPFCQPPGKDRWRFINREGSGNWICSQCGMGDGFNLAMRVLNTDFATMAKRVEEALRMPATQKRAPKPAEVSLAAMKRLWDEAMPLPGTPGERYFHRRGLPPPTALRFSPRVWYARDGAAPAIIAKVASPEGRCVNLYRIFVSEDGSKFPIEHPKRMMRRHVPAGIAVRLAAKAPVMGVSEGVENALAASVIFGIPVWAVLGTEFLERFSPPDEVEELVIFGDHDANFSGQKAAYTLAKRLAGKMRIRVEIPSQQGTDWNGALLAQLERPAGKSDELWYRGGVAAPIVSELVTLDGGG